ncbi:hypothetical protein HWV62_33381 [Athelia sp. TMB]|nr:hypothetical protein HWV62_33381 [Athelia sp. TMB]
MELAVAANALGDLLTQVSSANSPTESWTKIETTAQSLANGLRTRDETNHTALGRTPLPQTLTSLLKSSVNDSSIPSTGHEAAVFELLRIGANLAMDHGKSLHLIYENRGHLLEAGFPQEVVSLLEGYVSTIPDDFSFLREPLPLTTAHLKIIKTAIGALLNAVIGSDAVRSRLTSLDAAKTMLQLAVAIYPAASWITVEKIPGTADGDLQESWDLRSGLSNWAWRTIEELKDDARPGFNPDILPFLTPTLLAFIPPFSKPVSSFSHVSPDRSALLKTDYDLLEETCTLLESLALDVEDVRLSLARGVLFPAEHNGVPCLSHILDFIEKGDYPPLWSESSLDSGYQKKFDICKAALIKAIVEVAGDDKNEDVLWDETEADQPGGAFVCRMVQWVRSYAHEDIKGRDDLVICATLSLGNLARRETNSTALLTPPHSIASLLSSDAFLSATTDIKVKHGVVGLLKHLAQSSGNSLSNRAALSDSGVLQRLVKSGIWVQRGDPMVEVVQMGAIGVVKHLCNNSALKDADIPSGVSQIVSLAQQSDTVAIKSEGSRVLVNVIKSLWASDAQLNDAQKKLRLDAIAAVLQPSSAQVLASLVGRSMKYPLLVNEGVVALTLLSTHKDGAPLVLSAILAPLPVEASPAPGSMPTSAPVSEVSSPIFMSPTSASSRIPIPRRALDRLAAVLRNQPSSDTSSSTHRPKPLTFPVEVRANVCALLGQIGKIASGDQADRLDAAVKSTLEDLSKGASQGKDNLLGNCAKRVIEGWATLPGNGFAREPYIVVLHVEFDEIVLRGTDVKHRAGMSTGATANPTSVREEFLARAARTTTDVGHALYSHRKILVAALNGPVMGISAAFLGYFDVCVFYFLARSWLTFPCFQFIYAMPNVWLSVPFTFLGIVAEGGASVSFVNRMGLAKANEALIWGKKIEADDLLKCGFLNKILVAQPVEEFHAAVRAVLLSELQGLDPTALLVVKRLLKAGLADKNDPDAVNLRESYAQAERFASGIPGERFRKIAAKEIKHKL